MRKLVIAVLLTVFSFSSVTTAFAQIQSFESSVSVTENINNNVAEYTFEDILSLEPYISVKDGLFMLNVNKASKAGIDSELIRGQQEYLDSLNQAVKNGVLSVSKNLTIKDLSDDTNQYQNDSLTPFAACKPKGVTRKAQKFWWGYKTLSNSCDTKKLISDANTAGATGGIVGTGGGLLGLFFPVLLPGAGVAGLTGAYFYLFATRLDANNNGKGVIVEMTWAAVYDITPQ
ncbi:MAG: hypothetical protein RR651_02660 [Lysinibacillus sp.]